MTDPRIAPARGSGWRLLADRRRRLIAGGLAAAVLTIGGFWIWAASRQSIPPKRAARGNRTTATAPGGSMPGMDMAGMNMSTDGSALLSPEQVREFGITFGFVEERQLTGTLNATGTVTVPETGLVRVSPKAGGYIERLYAEFTGAPVGRGQALAELYSPELLAAQEELLLASRADRVVGASGVPGVPAASVDLAGAARRRLRLLDVPEAQIDEVVRTGRARRTVTIVSPASGVIVEKSVTEGQAIGAGMAILTIADLARVWVDVAVREADAGALRTGLGVDVEVAGLPGTIFKGRVEFIQPFVDAESRTVRARVGVSNTGNALKPGMYATARVLIPSRRALTVPASAVVRTGERSVVFVDMGGGRLMPHDVETGTAAGDFVEVLSGLEPGQRVVTSAQFLLESESNIAEVMRAMMGQTGSGDMNMKMDMPAAPPTKRP